MLLDPTALAWSSWLGLSVGVIGLLVSIFGLIFTFKEARGARQTAEATQAEVKRALRLVRSRGRLAAFASAVSQADIILLKIEQDALRSSPELFTGFRRAILEAIQSFDEISSQSKSLSISKVRENLNTVDKLIRTRMDQKEKIDRMVEVLSETRTFLLNFEAEAKLEDFA